MCVHTYHTICTQTIYRQDSLNSSKFNVLICWMFSCMLSEFECCEMFAIDQCLYITECIIGILVQMYISVYWVVMLKLTYVYPTELVSIIRVGHVGSTMIYDKWYYKMDSASLYMQCCVEWSLNGQLYMVSTGMYISVRSMNYFGKVYIQIRCIWDRPTLTAHTCDQLTL